MLTQAPEDLESRLGSSILRIQVYSQWTLVPDQSP